MSAKPLPEGYVLTPEAPGAMADGYQHWTVADLIEILSEYPQDARVWIIETWPWDDDDDVVVRPLESVVGGEGEVFL